MKRVYSEFEDQSTWVAHLFEWEVLYPHVDHRCNVPDDDYGDRTWIVWNFPKDVTPEEAFIEGSLEGIRDEDG